MQCCDTVGRLCTRRSTWQKEGRGGMSFTGCPRHARILHTSVSRTRDRWRRPRVRIPCMRTQVYIYIYIYGELWIYRTLMHNALRDDGKYGYITRQRPMLFSPASHWLMLIRKSNVAGNRRARGTKMQQRAFIKASLMDPSLPLFLSLSLAVLFLPRKRAKPSKS